MKQQGQYSHAEFLIMYAKRGSTFDVVNGHATIHYGKETTNYYYQHSDGSWTNYDCKTCRIFI